MSYLQGRSSRFAAASASRLERAAYWLLALAAIVAICAMSGCVNVAELREDALYYEALNRQHSNNPALHPAARGIAHDNAEAWAAQAWELGGPKPASVAEVGS